MIDPPANPVVKQTGENFPALDSDEIEGLLQQAQEMAETLAESVDLETEVKPESADVMPSPDQAEGDATSATEQVERDVATLSESMEEEGGDAMSTGTAMAAENVAPVTTEAIEEVETGESVEHGPVEATRVVDLSETLEEREGTGANIHESDVRGDDETTDDVAKSSFDAAGAATTPETAEKSDGHAIGGWRVLRQRLARLSAMIGRTVVFMVRLIDLPISWMSPGAKNLLGMIGLLSLVMGAGAMMLPKLVVHNPYASMPPFPKAETPAEGDKSGTQVEEHGGSKHEAASGHH